MMQMQMLDADDDAANHQWMITAALSLILIV